MKLYNLVAGKSRLTPRQACGVESAARQSGLSVYLVLLSPTLDLTDNTTCQLAMSQLDIHFFTVNYTSLARGTPLYGFFDDPKLLSSKYRPGHTADALRLGNNNNR